MRHIYLAAFLFTLYCFCNAILIAPFCPEQGYTLGCAKLIANGYSIYEDFNCMDSPIGIYIFSFLHKISPKRLGITAVYSIMGIHLLNLSILFFILKQLKIDFYNRLIAISIYLLVLLSFNGVTVSLEPIALFFVLLSIYLGLYQNKKSLIGASILLVIGILCKTQFIWLIPAISFFIGYSNEKNNPNWRKMKFFLFSFSCISILVLTLTFIRYDEIPYFNIHLTTLLANLQHIPYINLGIFTIKSGILLIISGFLLCNKYKVANPIFYITTFTYLIISLAIFIEPQTNWGVYLAPFISISIAQEIQIITSIKTKYIHILCCLIVAVFFAFRTYNKFDGGSIKEEQISMIEALDNILEKPSKVAILYGSDPSEIIGPQIYSEVSGIIPVDLKNTEWGIYNWGEKGNSTYIEKCLNEADYIILTNHFSCNLGFYSHKTKSNWSEELNDFINTHNAMSVGELEIIKRN